jgi:hypothetical protein
MSALKGPALPPLCSFISHGLESVMESGSV